MLICQHIYFVVFSYLVAAIVHQEDTYSDPRISE